MLSTTPLRQSAIACLLLLMSICLPVRAAAAPLAPGATVSGTVPSNGAVQSYTFQARAGDTIIVSMLPTQVTTFSLSPSMKLYAVPESPSDSPVQVDAATAGVLTRAYLDYTVPGAPGDQTLLNYRLDCTGLIISIPFIGNRQTFGNFALTLVIIPDGLVSGADDGGGALLPGPDGEIGVLIQGDVDAYTFTAAAGKYISVTVTGLDGAVIVPTLRLYRRDGTLVPAQTDALTGNITLAQIPVTGDYYIVAYSATGLGIGQYRITVLLYDENQPDLAIRNQNESFQGEGIYTTVMVEQQKRSNDAAIFFVKLTNRSFEKETFRITGTRGDTTNFTVRYLTLLGQPIEGLMNGTGWTITDLDPGATVNFRVEVTLTPNVPSNQYRDVTITAISQATENNKSDTVIARVRKKPFTSVELTATPSDAAAINTPVTLLATPDGGGVINYKFYMKTLGILWLQVPGNTANWTSSNTCLWKSTNVPGPYSFRVVAKELATSIQHEDIMPYTIALPLSQVFLSTDPPVMQTMLNPVELKATPLFGAKPVYKFDIEMVMEDGSLIPWGSTLFFSETPTVTWAANGSLFPPFGPVLPGQYRLTVTAKDENTATPKEFTTSTTYIVLPTLELIQTLLPTLAP